MALLRLILCGLIFCSSAFAASPARLSEWGVLGLEGGILKIAPGSVPYELATPLFSDYASKLRVLKLPPGTKASFDPSEVFDFPLGTVIAKTFAYPTAALREIPPGIGVRVRAPALLAGGEEVLLIETRILVKEARGWVAIPYVWQEAIQDAVPAPTGWAQEFGLRVENTWLSVHYEVPNTNQCRSCHIKIEGFTKKIIPIGLKARLLNRPNPISNTDVNQLTQWASLSMLDGLPDLATVERAVNAYDANVQPIAARARSYLDVNCGHCHRATGIASSTGLFLDAHTTEARHLGVCKSPVAAGNGGSTVGYDIEPGHPERSLVYKRLAATDPSTMMPELGRSVADGAAVRLISDWIATMEGSCTPP